jgi:tRNA(fMet)-specific endonuclease VapC
MTFLLDSNTCIGFLNGRAPGVIKRLQTIPPQEVAVCAVVKAELFYGARRSKDPSAELAKVEKFFAPYASLPFDDRCAEVHGEVRAHLAASGMLIGPHDLLIAAIALANDLTLVTHNVREFSRVPRLRIDDWEAGSP